MRAMKQPAPQRGTADKTAPEPTTDKSTGHEAESNPAWSSLAMRSGQAAPGFASPPAGNPAGDAPAIARPGIVDARGDRAEQTAALLDVLASNVGLDPRAIQVHADDAAARTAAVHGSEAVVVGDVIHLDGAAYDPGASMGRMMLAHEVAHVAQRRLPTGSLAAAEREASRFATAFVRGGALPRLRAGLAADAVPTWYPPGRDHTTISQTQLSPDGFVIGDDGLWIERLWYQESYQRNPVAAKSAIIDELAATIMPWIQEIPRRDKVKAAKALELSAAFPDGHDTVFVPIDEAAIYVHLGLPPGTSFLWDIVPDQTAEAASEEMPHLTARLVVGNRAIKDSAVRGSGRTLSPALASQILAALEARTGLMARAEARQYFLDQVDVELARHGSVTVVIPARAFMLAVFGEEAWTGFERRSAEAPSAGPGRNGGEPSVTIDPLVSREDHALARRLFDEIGRISQDGARISITSKLVVSLREIDGHAERARIIEMLRTSGQQPGQDEQMSTASISEQALRRAIHAAEMQAAHERLGLTPTSSTGKRPVPRPVEGHIVNQTDLLFVGKEASFVFRTTSRASNIFAVPWVTVRWIIRETSDPHTSALRLDEDSSLYRDGFDPPEPFTYTFERVGIYEINALVDHDFYLPSHFTTYVEVKTERERFEELEEQTYGMLPLFRDAQQTEAEHEFLGASGTDVDRFGRVFDGSMPIESRPGDGPLPGHLDQLDGRIRHIEGYMSSGRIDHAGLAWAEEYLTSMRESRQRIQQELDAGAHLLHVQGVYLSRGGEAHSQSLALVAHARRIDEGWIVTIHDTTQAFDTRNSRFTGTDRTFRHALERCFTELCKSYPRGQMSLRIEALDDAGQPTGRFIGFELDCDSTWEAVRRTVWAPAVQVVVNVLGAAVAIFLPMTAPFLIPTLMAYSAVDTIANVVDLSARDALTWGDVAIAAGQIAIDLVPFLGRASGLVKVGTTTFHIMEGVELAGEAVLMTVEAMEQVQTLRFGAVRQAAELHAQIAQLEQNNSSDPALASLRAQLHATQQEAREAWWKVGGELAEQRLIMRASMRVIHGIHAAQQRRMADAQATLQEAAHTRGRKAVRPGDVEHLERALGVRVEVETAGRASGDSGDVRVHYEVQPLGGIANVRLVVGPTASLDMVLHHQATVTAMRRYQGVCGSLRNLLERIRAFVGGGGHIPPGSRAFEARFELEKLPLIIVDLHTQLEGRALDDVTRRQLELQTQSLKEQLQRHASALDDLAPGLGYVAAIDDGTTGRPPKGEQPDTAATGSHASRQDEAGTRHDAPRVTTDESEAVVVPGKMLVQFVESIPDLKTRRLKMKEFADQHKMSFENALIHSDLTRDEAQKLRGRLAQLRPDQQEVAKVRDAIEAALRAQGELQRLLDAGDSSSERAANGADESKIEEASSKDKEAKMYAVRLAIEAYGIDDSQLTGEPDFRPKTSNYHSKYEMAFNFRGVLEVHPAAFESGAESPGMFAATLAHELEVHARQRIERRWAESNPRYVEVEDPGNIFMELEAYRYMLVEARRFGLNTEERNKIREMTAGYLANLCKYAEHVPVGLDLDPYMELVLLDILPATARPDTIHRKTLLNELNEVLKENPESTRDRAATRVLGRSLLARFWGRPPTGVITRESEQTGSEMLGKPSESNWEDVTESLKSVK